MDLSNLNDSYNRRICSALHLCELSFVSLYHNVRPTDLLSPTLVWSELSSHQHRRDPIEFWKANLLFYNSIALTCNSMRFSCGCVSGCCPGSRDKFEHATILSDQLASLSTGLEAKSRLLDAKRGGSWRPEARSLEKHSQFIGRDRNDGREAYCQDASTTSIFSDAFYQSHSSIRLA